MKLFASYLDGSHAYDFLIEAEDIKIFTQRVIINRNHDEEPLCIEMKPDTNVDVSDGRFVSFVAYEGFVIDITGQIEEQVKAELVKLLTMACLVVLAEEFVPDEVDWPWMLSAHHHTDDDYVEFYSHQLDTHSTSDQFSFVRVNNRDLSILAGKTYELIIESYDFQTGKHLETIEPEGISYRPHRGQFLITNAPQPDNILFVYRPKDA
jgi:hypothetical protein